MRPAASAAPLGIDARFAWVATNLIFFLTGTVFAHWVVRIPAVEAYLDLRVRLVLTASLTETITARRP